MIHVRGCSRTVGMSDKRAGSHDITSSPPAWHLHFDSRKEGVMKYKVFACIWSLSLNWTVVRRISLVNVKAQSWAGELHRWKIAISWWVLSKKGRKKKNETFIKRGLREGGDVEDMTRNWKQHPQRIRLAFHETTPDWRLGTKGNKVMMEKKVLRTDRCRQKGKKKITFCRLPCPLITLRGTRDYGNV